MPDSYPDGERRWTGYICPFCGARFSDYNRTGHLCEGDTWRGTGSGEFKPKRVELVEAAALERVQEERDDWKHRQSVLDEQLTHAESKLHALTQQNREIAEELRKWAGAADDERKQNLGTCLRSLASRLDPDTD